MVFANIYSISAVYDPLVKAFSHLLRGFKIKFQYTWDWSYVSVKHWAKFNVVCILCYQNAIESELHQDLIKNSPTKNLHDYI